MNCINSLKCFRGGLNTNKIINEEVAGLLPLKYVIGA